MANTTTVTLQEDAWVEISSNAAFTCQNNTAFDVVIASAASLPSAASKVGFVLKPEQVFQTASITKTWYGILASNGTETAPLVVEED